MAATSLEILRRYTAVDIDSLDVEVAKSLGPFVDCTSNQAIAYLEASKDSDASRAIVREAAVKASQLETEESRRITTGVRALMVLLSLRVLPYVTGRVLVQSSMRSVHSIEETVADALLIFSIYTSLSPSSPTSRLCVKIPSTWEGLRASRILERDHDIRTLATAVFSKHQAAIAWKVGSTYISPYLNELRSYSQPDLKDPIRGLEVIKDIWVYYKSVGSKTLLKPARYFVWRYIFQTLTSIDEVLAFGGADHLTISSTLLHALSTTPAPPDYIAPFHSLLATPVSDRDIPLDGLANDEAAFRTALREDKFETQRKLDEAIEFFLGFELKMEELIRAELENIKMESRA